MSEQERPKPDEKLVKWFEKATEKITDFEKEIKELVEKEKEFWNYSFSLVKKGERRTLFLEQQKYAQEEFDQIMADITSKRRKADFLKDLQDESGVCPQCGGTGYHDRFDSLQSGGPFNKPPTTCDKCWGSGWKDGNKNPFDEITHAMAEKLD